MTIDLSFWSTVWIVVFVLGVGVVSGRILGIHRGFGRATAAGVLGSLVGVIVAAIILQNDHEATEENVILVAFGFALLATMVVSIVLEVLLRPRRSRRRPSFRTRAQTFFTVGGRLFEVTRIARRHGLAGPRVASRSALSTPQGALRIKLFLQDCGGMFVKFGQIASTRSDLLPAPLVAELAELQSNVRPVPVEQIREIVEHETQADAAEAAKDWQRVTQRYGSREFSAGPAVSLRPGVNGLDIVVRYITRAPRRNVIKSKLFQAIVELLHKPE